MLPKEYIEVPTSHVDKLKLGERFAAFSHLQFKMKNTTSLFFVCFLNIKFYNCIQAYLSKSSIFPGAQKEQL